jgi:hypothetical protein
MNFILGFPRTQAGYDSIWVIMDRLTKVAHFIPVKMTHYGAKLTELYMSWILCLHGVPKKIILDRGSQFTSKFCEKLHESMDPKLNFSLAYHPQTDGQTERTNQILEDMLRACTLMYGKIGTRVFHTPSFCTTTVIKLAWRCYPLRLYMDSSAGPRCFEVRWEKGKCLDQKC